MAKTTVLLPEELTKMNAVIVKRSDLERALGMVDALAYVAVGSTANALAEVGDILRDMLCNNK